MSHGTPRYSANSNVDATGVGTARVGKSANGSWARGPCGTMSRLPASRHPSATGSSSAAYSRWASITSKTGMSPSVRAAGSSERRKTAAAFSTAARPSGAAEKATAPLAGTAQTNVSSSSTYVAMTASSGRSRLRRP
jgi:hypothetical protein